MFAAAELIRSSTASLRLILFALVAGAALAAEGQLAVPLLSGEKWWGGRVVDGAAMPYGATRAIARSLHAIDPESNQIQPLLVSSAGRYVWNEGPFAFAFADGKLRLSQASADFTVATGGKTLADAFRAAARAHFPPTGRMPAPLLFTAPQYNTWIELLYEQRQERVLKYAHDLVAAGYPPGVLMIDDNWQEAYGTWEFSARRFSDSKAMMAELHRLGFKVMLWVCPFVSADTEVFRALEKSNLLLKEKRRGAAASTARPAIVRWWNGASAVLDLSNPEARAWFHARLDRLRREFGVDGFKFDAGDSPFYLSDTPGVEFTSHRPRTPEEHTEDFAAVGRDFPFNEYRACWKMAGEGLAQRLRDKDHTWDALRELIPGIVAQGLMGYAFTCPDMIGGGWSTAFEDPKKFDPELVVRSAQVHALMPMMQFSVAPWRVLDHKQAAICLAAAKLHARLGPTLLAFARHAAQTGEPIVRPLAWQWPGRDYEEIHDQFMLGDEILVAPVVVKGARSRRVAFPPGKWRGDDDVVIEGPVTKEIAAPLERIPHFQLVR